jgi:hypothetical protein
MTMQRTLTLVLSLSLSACGGLIDTGGVDESEMEGLEIAAALQVPGQAIVYNTGGVGLNLRAGAGTNYQVLLTMPEGAEVSVIGGPKNAFYQVRYNGRTGWSHGGYLKAKPGGGGGGGGQYPGNIHWNPAHSGNYTQGRQGARISYIVIHDTEGSYAGAISWFKNPASNVSAHYILRSSDGDITQMVREQDIAWHAGNWNYNKAAIGIEHEGWMSQPDRWYTEVMYRRSAQLTAAIAKRYGVPVDRQHIIGHYQVPRPNDHVDPGPGWKWDHYMDLVRSFLR